MVYQSTYLFLHGQLNIDLLFFVFFATMCSYNFHWYLSVDAASESKRLGWAIKNKTLHFVLYLIGVAGSLFYFYKLREHWIWISLGAFVTFLYSAPKIPQKMFIWLRKIAVGKTVFLTMVWMYVTTILPFAISGEPWQASFSWFACSRFFLIYAICILFDYRDREADKASNIRSMITYLDEKGINVLFEGSLAAFLIFSLLLTRSIGIINVGIILIPGIITGLLYNYAKKNFSDYLYYFILDGLMMLSALIMLIFRI